VLGLSTPSLIVPTLGLVLPDPTHDLSQEQVTEEPAPSPPLAPPGLQTKVAELKVIFWNANTWNAQNCEKLVETASVSNADVICIIDARLDNFKTRYIGGYCNTLHRATGKTWRAKLEARPDRRMKCMVGGDIIFYSEKCTKVVKNPTLPYGTISTLTLIWEGISVKVLSVYRPYENKEASEGALRTAVLKVNADFEADFWDEITKVSDVPTIIGGDFNLGVSDLDTRLLGSSMARAPLPDGVTTYMSFSQYRVSVIDHIISN
jgi:exonuclease III